MGLVSGNYNPNLSDAHSHWGIASQIWLSRNSVQPKDSINLDTDCLG